MPSYVAEVYFKVRGLVERGPTPFIIQDAEHELLVHAPSLEHAKAAILDKYEKISIQSRTQGNYIGLSHVQISEHANPAPQDVYPWDEVINVE